MDMKYPFILDWDVILQWKLLLQAVKVKQKSAVFTFEILGLNPSKINSASRFEGLSSTIALCNCWLVKVGNQNCNWIQISMLVKNLVTKLNSQCCRTRTASQLIECYQFRFYLAEPQKRQDQNTVVALLLEVCQELFCRLIQI